MIGKLTIDKASMNISYFLYTIKIIKDSNGRVSRKNFGKKMGEFIGIPYIKDGKENRTPYNKSKLPRYFGFVDIEYGENNESFLVLTHRGEVLVNYIKDKGEKFDALQRFAINPTNRSDFIDLIFESVIFDSFGKNNCGAEQSNTDVEPPKVVFKTILELGRATAEEICFVMFGLNRGYFKSFEEAIETIKQNRKIGKHDYKQITEEWEITNIVKDCKIINIFTDKNIRLLISQKDDNNGKLYYSLSNSLDESHKEQIRIISATYSPVRLFAYTNGNIETVKRWVDYAVLGRVSNNDLIFRYDMHSENEFCFDYSKNKRIFEQALLKAFQEEKKNVYIVVDGITEVALMKKLGFLGSLLRHKDNFLEDDHGWSLESIENEQLYNYLTLYSTNARKQLEYKKVKLPSNLHIVGAMIMSENNKKIEFDYEFQRCLVNTDDSADTLFSSDIVIDENNRISAGENVLLYGVPGSGKSWTIEHDYCKKGCIVERLVFHPDYTNADFIGQILPVVDPTDKMVTYEFTPGPFTNILREAYINPTVPYVLIIEEINRGNAPAIFGDIFQLLDRTVDKKIIDGIEYPRGTSEYGITNRNIAKVVYEDEKHKVRIPSNLSILGTMNTSDQNVFTLDTAFQRRWSMRLIENNFENVRLSLANAPILDTTITWKTFCEKVNKLIIGNSAKMASAEDKRLGVYFIHENDLIYDDRANPTGNYSTTLDELNDLLKAESSGELDATKGQRLEELREALLHNRLFPEKVIKYLWDDAFKFYREALFDIEIMDSLEKVIRTFVFNTGFDRFKIFRQSVRDSLNPSQG